MYALKPGELSQPVLTPFGWHLIRVDSKAGDTLDVRHILVSIGQSDSSATRTDRRADSLASKAGSQSDPKAFDEAAKTLGLSPASVVVFENEPLSYAGRYVPSVSAWAFSGVSACESSDLFDSNEAYYLARVDSLTVGGQQSLADVKDDVRRRLAKEKRLEKLRPIAEQLASAARSSTLEAAAGQRGLQVEKSAPFARVDAVPRMGQFEPAIGASFTVPVGQIGGPFKAVDGMVVLRVDSRTDASRPAFEADKAAQRQQLVQSLRQQRVDEFLTNLRESVMVVDQRPGVMAALRRQSDI
jgi:peptidyl-prolyl cis-trans isomerase D